MKQGIAGRRKRLLPPTREVDSVSSTELCSSALQGKSLNLLRAWDFVLASAHLVKSKLKVDMVHLKSVLILITSKCCVMQ